MNFPLSYARDRPQRPFTSEVEMNSTWAIIGISAGGVAIVAGTGVTCWHLGKRSVLRRQGQMLAAGIPANDCITDYKGSKAKFAALTSGTQQAQIPQHAPTN